MRRAAAALLALLLTSAIAAPVACAGWESSPASRRACCLRAHHDHCKDQARADNCCASHEQTRQGLSMPAATFAEVQPAASPCPVPAFELGVPETLRTAVYAAAIARRLHGPPGPLSPPLRL